MARRLLPSLAALLLAMAVLVPLALSLPQHIDEVEHTYIAAYYGGKISRLDFAPVAGSDEFLDPGWTPVTFWTLTQPMGPRYMYSAALGITQAPPPYEPRNRVGDARDNPLTHLSTPTLNTMRFTAVLLAAVGLALIAHRFRWAGVVAIAMFLFIPHVREDLARGWAEGPLLFGFGLAAATWGTRAFAPVCGLAVLYKLNALPLWLLAFHHGFGRSRYQHIAGIGAAWLTWTALEPPAWFMGGPLYLGMMLRMRWLEFADQSGRADPELWGGLFGHYFPTRYLWPIELAVLLSAAWLATRYWQRLHSTAAVAEG